jgi:lysophospholipase L1-like esterase
LIGDATVAGMTIAHSELLRPFTDALRAKRYQVLIALGDSNTCNAQFTAGLKQWPELLHDELRGQLGTQEITLVNAGISGDAVTEAAARLERDVIRHHPDLVVVCLGSNDAGRLGDDDFARGLDAILDRIIAAGATIMLRTPTPVVEMEPAPKHLWTGDDRLRAKNAVIRVIAARRGCAFVDTYEQFWALERAGALHSGSLFCDAVHTNGAGHRLVCRGLLPAFGLSPTFCWER